MVCSSTPAAVTPGPVVLTCDHNTVLVMQPHQQDLPNQQSNERQLPEQSPKQHPLEQQSKQQRTSSNGIDKDTAMLPTPFTSSNKPFADGDAAAGEYLNRASSPSVRLQNEYRGGLRPDDELARISTLQSLDILDTEPCPKYDDITKLLCSIFHVPIAQLSLVDSDRQWCKSVQGLDMRQMNRDIAFCAWVLLPKHPTALVVEDTHQDARYSDCKQYRSQGLGTLASHACLTDKQVHTAVTQGPIRSDCVACR